jgi:transglutaminase-like putative cysteine protease
VHLSPAQIVSDAAALATDDRHLAVLLHDVVRDQIRFGFTPWFDDATPERTLRMRVGHCNPQADLLVSLMRVGGLAARFRPVTIGNDVLYGVASAPARLSHVFTEVRLDRRWIRLDSYIVDPALRAAVLPRLARAGRTLGFGCHVDAVEQWDGVNDAFSQIANDDLIIELHDPVDRLQDFYGSGAYQHRIGPASFATLLRPLRLVGPLGTMVMSRGADRARSSDRN